MHMSCKEILFFHSWAVFGLGSGHKHPDQSRITGVNLFTTSTITSISLVAVLSVKNGFIDAPRLSLRYAGLREGRASGAAD